MTPLESVEEYCDNILTGKIKSGLHLRNAVARFNADMLENSANGFDFSRESFEKVVTFVQSLKHFTGIHAGKNFVLQPWQLFIVANIYGFYNTDGTRRFQTVYLEMARKQGKTALVAALSLYHLIKDDEAGGEILFTANSLDQAKIGFRMVNGFTKGIDPNGKTLVSRFKDVSYPRTDSFLRVLAADSSKLDGYNCSFGAVDEYHSAPTPLVRDVLRSSMGMRTNPILFTITTAGFDKSLPCYELRTVCSEILSGAKTDDSFFGVIYCIDEKDNWKDKDVWIKSNPNLDITVTEKFLKTQVQQAINNPSDEVGVKTKNINLWCDSATTWIPDDYIVNATKKLNRKDFRGEVIFSGVDLASNVDLTACSYLCVKDGIYYFTTDYYIPAETLVTRVHVDKELYKQWVRQKYLKTTSGNVTDYDHITRDMLELDKVCDLRKVFYDKYNANSWAIQCTEQGLKLEPFSQTIANFNNCTREFERLILSGKVVLDENPITRYCMRNVELRIDMNGNVKPLKNSEKKKIDGVIGMLQALAAYIDSEENYRGTAIY